MRYGVSAFPLYEDGKTGDLCSYFEHESLEAAMQQAGRGCQLWIDAPAEESETEKEGFCGFDVTVEIKS